MEKYIPKIIHYCWFGKRNKPKLKSVLIVGKIYYMIMK